jgi:hypothetical protein
VNARSPGWVLVVVILTALLFTCSTPFLAIGLDSSAWFVIGPAIGVLLMASLSIVALRYQDMPPTQECPRCGYDTRGLRTPMCPECGTRLPHRREAQDDSHPDPRESEQA